MSLTAIERETVITLNDDEDHAEIWTAQRPWITKLKKNPAVTLIKEGKHEGSAWAHFKMSRNLITIRSGKRASRPLTDAERQARADNLRRARETRQNAS